MFDHSTMAQAFSHPGIDPRCWVAMGTVERESEGTKSVHFDGTDGAPLPTGPLVSVRLHPYDVTVACRVAGQSAGNGEGEWAPFVEGDEVVVVVPEGTERAGCVIVGRMNSGVDAWPRDVAGQDATGNEFAFRRQRSPFIFETASSYMVRSATTGAQFVVDLEGNILASSGARHQLVLRSDFVSLALGDGRAKMQLDPSDGSLLAYAGGGQTQFLLDGSASQFLTSGTLNVGTSGLAGSGHAVTLEQVLNMFVQFVYFLNATGGGISLALSGATGPLFAPTFPVNFVALLQTMITAAISPIPPTPGVGGGNLTALGLGPMVAAALLAQLPDPAALAPVPIFQPGIGRPGFVL